MCMNVPRPLNPTCSVSPEDVMRYGMIFLAVMTLSASPGLGLASDDASPDACAVVAAAAVPVLPPPLRSFFEARIPALQHAAASSVAGPSNAGTLLARDDRHYVMLDVAVAAAATERRAAARRFPHDRAKAMALYQKHGVEQGGTLPWVILDRYEALTRAMRSNDADAILLEAGAVLRFATDAALPFNTTADRDGISTENLYWTAPSPKDDASSDRTVRHRFQRGLLHRLRSRLEYEVRVAPQRHRPVTKPRDAIFATLIDAADECRTLLAIDAEAVAALEIVDARSFATAADAYYDRLAERSADIMESRLEAAVLLGANLIGAAWLEAGRPSPAAWRTSATPSKRDKPAPEAAFLGSRHSTVFHRASCPHAKRIKRANILNFRTARDARNAGRVPCKSCKPGGR